MNSRKISLIRLVKEWITDPKEDKLVELLDSATDTITTMRQTTTTPPEHLVDALRETPGQVTVATIPLPQMSVTVAIFPTGATGAAREGMVWSTIRSRSFYWSTQAEDAHRMERERLEPEIGGMRITTTSGSAITILNSEYSHKTGVAILRAIRAGVMLPVAAVADSMYWATRRAKENPLPTFVISTAVAAGIALNTAEVGDLGRDPLPVRPPLTAYTITVPATVTRTTTLAPRERSTTRPAPRTWRMTSDARPHLATTTANPASAPATRPPTPTPEAMRPGTGHAPATHLPTAGPTAPAIPATTGATAPASPTPLPSPSADECDGVVRVGATVDPLVGVDVCVG